jgi:hypothetical protein
MDMTCSVDHEPLKEGEPHCHLDKTTMNCDGNKCVCPLCDNTVMVSDIKCDNHLGLES